MIALSCPRPEVNGTEQEDINQNPFVKSFHSFKGIAEDFWNGVGIRRDKALDSPYDFVNYWTFGVSDGILSGANERSAKMFDSKLDFLDYATFGFSGMVKEAVSPEESFSKEHWLNSFGLAGSIFGVGKLVTSPVKKSRNTAVDGTEIDEMKNVTESKSNIGIGKTSEGISMRTDKVQTGGRELSVDEYLKQLDKAEEMYGSFRKSKTDVQSIAKSTGMTEQRVQSIKEHLFIKEHIKEHGIGRFESNYQIGQAWDRFQKGTYNKNDIDLLNHELFETKFEGIFKTDYRTAHDKTVESGRPWYPAEEE